MLEHFSRPAWRRRRADAALPARRRVRAHPSWLGPHLEARRIPAARCQLCAGRHAASQSQRPRVSRGQPSPHPAVSAARAVPTRLAHRPHVRPQRHAGGAARARRLVSREGRGSCRARKRLAPRPARGKKGATEQRLGTVKCAEYGERARHARSVLSPSTAKREFARSYTNVSAGALPRSRRRRRSRPR